MKRLVGNLEETFKDIEVRERDTDMVEHDDDTATAWVHYIILGKYEDQESKLGALANRLDGEHADKVCEIMKINVNEVAGKIQNELSDFAMAITPANISVKASYDGEVVDVYFEVEIEG